MKNFKNVLIGALALCLSVGMLTACGGNGSTTTAPTGSTTAATTNEQPSTDPTYVFTVICGDTQKPVSGVQVQICKGEEFCLMPVASDADGKVNYVLPAGNEYGEYDVHIIGGLPEGYTFDNSSVKTNATEHSYTLTLTGATPGGSTNPIGQVEHIVRVIYDSEFTDGQGTTHQAGDGIEGVRLAITNSEGTKLVASGTTDAKGELRFNAEKFIATETAKGYSIQVTGGIPDGLTKDATLSFAENMTVRVVSFYPVQEAGDRTAFSPTFVDQGEIVHVTISEPRTDDTNPLFPSVHDESLYYYAFRPTKPQDVGVYTASVRNISGGNSVYIGQYASSGVGFVAGTPNAQASGKEPVIQFMIEEQYLKDSTGGWYFGNRWQIGVKVEGENVSYPVTFELVIERVRDIVPGQDTTIINRVRPKAESSQTADKILGTTTGTLGYLPNGAKVVKDSKGFYHIGSVDGAYLMIPISKTCRVFGNESEEGAASFANVNEISGVESLAVSDYDEATNTATITYYNDMIQEYGKLCGKDGAYPMNQQLWDFLSVWLEQKKPMTIGDMTVEEAILYCCFVYQ